MFEGSSQFIAKKKLEGQVNPSEFNILIENQLLCLQSNNLSTRKSAAKVISKLDTNFSEQLIQSQPILALAVFIFSQDWYNQSFYLDSLSDRELEYFAREFQTLATSLSRKQVRLDCQKWINQALNKLKERQGQQRQRQEIQQQKQAKLEERKQKSIALRNQIETTLNQIRSVDPQNYDHFFSTFHLISLPILTLESNENNYHQLFQQHDDNLIDQLRKIDNSWSSHWRSQIQPLEIQKRSLESEESKLSQDLKTKEKEHTDNPMTWWVLCLVVWVIIGNLGMALMQILSPLMGLPVIIFSLISTVKLTIFIYNYPLKNLEQNLEVKRSNFYRIWEEITHLEGKQEKVSKLLRPLINR